MRISLEFTCKYRLKFAPNYVFTEKLKLCVNLKTMRIISQTTSGGSIGYTIDGKFRTLKFCRENFERIPIKEKLPF
jgi:hypothetical protein